MTSMSGAPDDSPVNRTPWAAGERLGPYVLIEPLGHGGMGEVWKARDERLDRHVAVKRVVNADPLRFEREARAIAALNHPNICQIYDVGPDYLVMEYIEGSPPVGPLPAGDALKLALQIATALEEAHDKHILHRDLKPGNILVTTHGVAKLLDFGLARIMSGGDGTRSQGLFGTPPYMSPEQFEGQTLDGRSDIFSFGAVLYELLSGRRAFANLTAVLDDDPEPLSGAGGDVAMRCLAKRPADRFQTVGQVKSAIAKAATKLVAAEQPSIAVLPFANMSLDEDQEFFSDGLAEEIITALAQIPGLKVTARTSAFAFRDKEQDIRQIAHALDVRTVLEGSVRRSGNRIRVTAQLINASDGYHLWSQRYDRELADVFAVQDDVATAIAGALQLKLTPGPSSERHKPSLLAHEAYLRARHFSRRSGAEPWIRAAKHYEEAIALDPDFATAYVDLAAHLLALVIQGTRAPGDVLPRARSLAQQALDLDPSLPDAHALLAVVAVMWNYDWNEAERRFALALAREPVAPMARQYCGFYLLAANRPLDALKQFHRAAEEDPLYLPYRIWVAISLGCSDRQNEAEQELRHILELDDQFAPAHGFLSQHLNAQGKIDDALYHAQRCYSLTPDEPGSLATFAGLLARSGKTDQASELMGKLPPVETYGVPRAYLIFHLILGEIEKGAEYMEKMIDQRDNTATITLRLSARALRFSARWPALIKRLNLPTTRT
jgi:serine/threonine-protein kinase